MFSFMLSLVNLKLCRVVYQGSVSNVRFYTVFAFIMFEFNSGSHSDMHTKLEDISHDIYQKMQQNKTQNITLTEDYQLI